MAGDVLDFKPVSRITIGTVGPPGQRVFLMQASKDSSTITLKIEKEQAKALSASILGLLEELDEKFPQSYSKVDEPLGSDLMLQEPFEPAFVVGQLGLGYDQEENLMILVAQQLTVEEEAQSATIRFWATRSQLKALAKHTLAVVEQGRPVCPLCNSPIDPEGHFCPRSNGHEKTEWT